MFWKYFSPHSHGTLSNDLSAMAAASYPPNTSVWHENTAETPLSDKIYNSLLEHINQDVGPNRSVHTNIISTPLQFHQFGLDNGYGDGQDLRWTDWQGGEGQVSEDKSVSGMMSDDGT